MHGFCSRFFRFTSWTWFLSVCLSVCLSAELIDAQECSKIAQESFDCLSILVMLKNCSVNPLLVLGATDEESLWLSGFWVMLKNCSMNSFVRFSEPQMKNHFDCLELLKNCCVNLLSSSRIHRWRITFIVWFFFEESFVGSRCRRFAVMQGHAWYGMSVAGFQGCLDSCIPIFG